MFSGLALDRIRHAREPIRTTQVQFDLRSTLKLLGSNFMI
jgi:hypothetical protein